MRPAIPMPMFFMPHVLLLGRRQANLCFQFAGSGENLPDIAKSREQLWTITFWLLAPDYDWSISDGKQSPTTKEDFQ